MLVAIATVARATLASTTDSRATCTLSDGVDFVGCDLVGADGKVKPQPCDTAAACCDLCSTKVPAHEPYGKCTAWSFNSGLSMCFLKNCTGKITVRASDTSGMLSARTLPTTGATRGINLPPTQGSTNAGAFLPGVYKYSYSAQDVANLRPWNFTGVRLPINVETALQPGGAMLRQLRGYVDALKGSGGTSVICMFDTLLPGQSGHGDGLVNNLTEMAAAWKVVFETFHASPVMFELFNEPFGYTTPSSYYAAMMALVQGASLPKERVILGGFGYDVSLREVVALGWTGAVAYHFYPNWVPAGTQTPASYAARVQADLAGVSNNAVYLTEFGTDLSRTSYAPKEDPTEGAVNSLCGLQDALAALRARGRGVAGLYHWHGWNNGDSYSFWAPGNQAGAAKVREVEAHA